MGPKPNFFIIGAPKCGTTSLAMWINDHPNGFISNPKEPSFFNSDIGLNRITNLDEYNGLFKQTDEQCKAIGEASTNYLQSVQAVPSILKYQQKAKIIAMVRNPLEMVVSLHNQELRDGNETINDFEKAWHLQESRSSGDFIPENCSHPSVLQYRERSRIGSQIARLREVVPAEQLKIVFFDDFVTDPLKTYKDVLQYLSIPYDGRTDFSAYNYSRTYRSPVAKKFLDHSMRKLKSLTGIKGNTGILAPFHRLNLKKGRVYAVPEQLLEELKGTFDVEIALLSSVTGRNLDHWFTS